MVTYQNAVLYVTDQVKQGIISVDEANVKLVQIMSVRLITNSLPASVRKSLNKAVKNGELGHIKKDGLRPEAYHHINARPRALAEREKHANHSIEIIKSVCI